VQVAEHMTPNPVTISAGASVDQALALMREQGVRHLPVMDDGVVAGLVTDIDLRTAWFPSLLSELTVKDLMNSHPLFVQADDTVYSAARLLYQHKVTGLLVMDHGRLAGIITLADLLKVFMELLGLLQESVRLDLALRPGSGSLEEVHGLIQAQGGKVISVALLSSEAARRIYSFRLEPMDVAPIAASLRAAGHDVLA
jgi:acetoin utilization protein AcuB